MNPIKFLPPGLLLGFIFLVAAPVLQAQPSAASSHDESVIPLAFHVNGGSINFFWPLKTGIMELQEKPAGSNEWQTVPESLYRTNGASVSATVPLAGTEVYYRIKRWPFPRKPVGTPGALAAPLPPAVTNRPARVKPASP